jgi:hypothetical protein
LQVSYLQCGLLIGALMQLLTKVSFTISNH